MRKTKRSFQLFEIAYQIKEGGKWDVFSTRAYYRYEAEKEFEQKVGVPLSRVNDYAYIHP